MNDEKPIGINVENVNRPDVDSLLLKVQLINDTNIINVDLNLVSNEQTKADLLSLSKLFKSMSEVID